MRGRSRDKKCVTKDEIDLTKEEIEVNSMKTFANRSFPASEGTGDMRKGG